MAVVEVTNRCNLKCPLCFSDAAPDEADVPLEQIHHRLQNLLQTTGEPVPLQISGGEPTLRNDLHDIIALARRLGFEHIELITNGVRIASEPHLLQEWKDKGLRSIYLQFDGLEAQSHIALRGRDLRQVRTRAIAAAEKAGLCCALACSITPGVNDHEIGAIIDFAWEHISTVRAVSFQAATPFPGRFEVATPGQGLTLDALLRLIEQQSGLSADTFLGEPLGHRACNALCYVFLVHGQRRPLFAHLSETDIQDLLAGQQREVILGLFAGKPYFFQHFLTQPRSWRILAKLAPLFDGNPIKLLRSKHLLIFAKSFVRPDDAAPDRLHRCCYGIAADSGVYSFCAYNHHYRFATSSSGQKY